MTRDLLWEIGLEEMPARFLPPAIKQLGELAAAAFGEHGLGFEKINVYASPRRLSLLVTALDEKAADQETEVKGPAKKAAYDENGQPTKALQGFCRGQGIDPAEMFEKELKGNIYMFAVKKSVGRPAMEMLPEILLSCTEKLYFPKPMRWGYNTLRFPRPVRWLVALFGSEVIDVSFGGLQADRYSRGHRLLGSDHIEISEPAAYLDALEKNFVIADQDRRKEMCREQIAAVAASFGGHVKEDDELLDEVTYLVEYPTALAGHFEDKYLEIPEELVTTPMVDQQRYFPVYDKDGKLMNLFITVRNGDARHLEIVAEGNEKVLRARLADAEFFYKEDLHDKLDDNVEKLAAAVFHEKLGNCLQKVERIVKNAVFIGEKLGYSKQEMVQTRRAAYLAKADLESRVVYEFPELQGIIGEYYANAAGEDPVVAQAIREHYQPRFAGDDLPETKPGIAVALADKLDSIAGFFAIGIIPSGSQDPFALRRAALGCVLTAVKNELDLSFRDVISYDFDLLRKDAPGGIDEEKAEERLNAAVAFLEQRAGNVMSDENIAYDTVNAVEAGEAAAEGNMLAIVRRARALQAFRSDARFDETVAALTRVGNIMGSVKEPVGLSIDPALFSAEAEKALYAAVTKMEKKAEPLLEQDDFGGVLQALADISPAVQDFFEAVMVNDEDPKVRGNRQALLKRIISVAGQIGDLRKIVSE